MAKRVLALGHLRLRWSTHPFLTIFFCGDHKSLLLRRCPSSSPAQLAPVFLVQMWHFGAIGSRVGPFQKVPSKGRECFSMKKCAWQDPDQSKSSTSATPTYFGSGKQYWAIRKLVLCREKRYWAFIRLVV